MKKGQGIISVIIVVLLLLTIGCDTGSSNGTGGSSVVTYAIGDTGPSGVGIVFYVTDGGLHGLEVAPVDQSTSATWSNITSTLIGTTGITVGTGSDNTDDIIGQSGHTASAAKICRDYRAAQEGDWFLPSKNELNLIWGNLVNDGFGNNSGDGSFAGVGYWSSSEYIANFAWAQDFSDSSQSNSTKNGTLYVRAVRAF